MGEISSKLKKNNSIIYEFNIISSQFFLECFKINNEKNVTLFSKLNKIRYKSVFEKLTSKRLHLCSENHYCYSLLSEKFLNRFWIFLMVRQIFIEKFRGKDEKEKFSENIIFA